MTNEGRCGTCKHWQADPAAGRMGVCQTQKVVVDDDTAWIMKMGTSVVRRKPHRELTLRTSNLWGCWWHWPRGT